MLYIKQHPAYFIFGAFLVGAAAGYYIPAETKAVLFICTAVITASLAGAAFFLYRNRNVSALICVAAFFLCLSAAFGTSYLYFNVKYAAVNAFAVNEDGIETEIEAVVLKTTYIGVYTGCYDIVIRRIGSESVNIKAKLRTDYPSDIGENERFIMKVTFESMNDDDPDILRYNLSDGFMIYAVSDNSAYIPLGDDGFSITYLFSRVNSYAAEKIKLWVGGDEGGYVSSLALGNSGDVPPELKRDIKRLGLPHILAVSGMHLTITLGIFNFILTRLRIHRRVIYVILIILPLIYMGITGFSPSVIRCALTTSLYYALLLTGFHPDPVSSLFISAVLVCLINPPSAMDIGLILSFSATLGLITAGGVLQRSIDVKLRGPSVPFRVLRRLLGDLSSGFCAVLFTLPFIWLYYGEISLVSPVMSLLFSPLASLTLFLTPLFLAVNFITPLGAIIAAALKLISYVFISAASFFAQSADFTVSLHYNFVKYIALLYIALILLLLLMKAKRVRLIFLPVFICAAAFGVCLFIYNNAHEGYSNIIYYNYKLGDGLAVIDDGKLLVCDISDGTYRMTGTGYDIGRDNNIGDVDVYMLTHYHNRHINTFIRLTAETYVKTLCLPEPQDQRERDIYNVLASLASERDCKITLYPREEKAAVMFGKLTLTLFPYTKLKRSPHPVICIGIGDDNESLLYLGGAVYESENADIVDRFASAANIIIIGAHSPKLKTAFSVSCISSGYIYFSDSADMSLVTAGASKIVASGSVGFTFNDD